MSKLKIIGIIISFLILISIIFLSVDYVKAQKGENPIFAIRVSEVRDGGTKIYLGLGYKVIDFHTLDGYDEVKIGTWLMQYEDFKEESKKEEIENNNYSSFFATVIESNLSYIIVEPYEGAKERKSSDKISIALGTENDIIYKVGTNLKITYNGLIMETYPAKIDAISIELKSVEHFELIFKSQSKELEKIVDKTDTELYSYNIYGYKGNVSIKINDKTYSLKEALLNNKIRMEEIIQKANQDVADKKIKSISYDDGGTIEYYYPSYTIIKVHKLDGNRDVYIGLPQMRLTDIQ